MMVVFGLILETTPELLMDWIEAELPSHPFGPIKLVGGEDVTTLGYEVNSPSDGFPCFVLTFYGIVWQGKGGEISTSKTPIHNIEIRQVGGNRTELLAESYDHPGYLEYLAGVRDRIVQVFPSRDSTPDPPGMFLLRSEILAAVDQRINAELVHCKQKTYSFQRWEYRGFIDYSVFHESWQLGYIRLSPSRKRPEYELTFFPCHLGSPRTRDKWQALRDRVRDAIVAFERERQVPTKRTDTASQPEYSHTQQVNHRTVRNLLLAGFTRNDLHRFCSDLPSLRPVCNDFSPVHGLNDLVDLVITYCDKHRKFGELLAEVEKKNPDQYQRYAPNLYTVVSEREMP
jgi:hypothetical protein